MKKEELEEAKAQISLYKEWRDVLLDGTFFRIQVVFYAENRKRRIRNLFLGCEHVFENMVHVAAQHDIRSAEIIGQLEVTEFVFVFFAEFRLHNTAALREKSTGLAGVTVRCAGILTKIFINVGSNTFVYCHIFLRKIIVILVIGIKIMKLPLINRNTD